MTKEDYREKVEEHRQEIDLHNESDTKLSRASRHQRIGKRKRGNPIMKLLVFVLIFIPLSILGYVWLIYDPSATESEKVAVEEKQDDVIVEFVKQDPDPAKAGADDTKEDNKDEKPAEKPAEKSAEKPDAEAVKKSEAEKQRLAAEEAKKAEQKLAQQKTAKEAAEANKDAAEAKKAEEAQKVAAQKAKELEEKKKAEAAASGQKKTHTVTSTDNLYRIAIKYYGDGSPANIAKIKAANNLSSDSISTGQVLVITP